MTEKIYRLSSPRFGIIIRDGNFLHLATVFAHSSSARCRYMQNFSFFKPIRDIFFLYPFLAYRQQVLSPLHLLRISLRNFRDLDGFSAFLVLTSYFCCDVFGGKNYFRHRYVFFFFFFYDLEYFLDSNFLVLRSIFFYVSRKESYFDDPSRHSIHVRSMANQQLLPYFNV